MADYRSDRKHGLLTGGVIPVLAWTIAWGVMGVALYISGVLNTPRTGPLWVALAGGALSWSVAGAITFPAVMREFNTSQEIYRLPDLGAGVLGVVLTDCFSG